MATYDHRQRMTHKVNRRSHSILGIIPRTIPPLVRKHHQRGPRSYAMSSVDSSTFLKGNERPFSGLDASGRVVSNQ